MIDIDKIKLHKTVTTTNKTLLEEKILPHVELMKHKDTYYFVIKNDSLYWTLYKTYKRIMGYDIVYDGFRISQIIPHSKWIEMTTEIPEDISNLKGIYGLYVDDTELVYIGYTQKSFNTRFCQHVAALNDQTVNQHLYKYLKNEGITSERLSIKPLFTTNDETDITTYGLECIEHAFITYFKPVGNVSGNTAQFRHSLSALNKNAEEQTKLINFTTNALNKIMKEYFENLKQD